MKGKSINMKLKIKKYNPLRKDIVDALRELIISGDLQPGERLIEPDIAEKLGVSRTPVREAFFRLESEGFVKVIPRKGAIVAPFSAKEAEDLYEILIELEGLAAKLACERMGQSELEKIKNIESKISSCEEYKERVSLNSQFHTAYLKYSKNNLLISVLENLHQKMNRYTSLVFRSPDRLKQGHHEHEMIMQAFNNKDSEKVCLLVKQHIDNSRKSLLQELEKNNI